MIPGTLSLTSISTTSAVISWAQLQSVSALRDCSLHYYSIGRPSTAHTVSLASANTETLITGLEPDTTYTVSVDCDSPFTGTLRSQSLNVTTLPFSRFLSNMQVSHITSSTAVISWDPPTSGAGQVLSYSIGYGPSGSDRPMKNIIVFPPNTSLILTGLNESTPHIVTVAVKTSFAGEQLGSTLYFKTKSFIDVCVNNPCGPNASCTQQDGSFRCSCVTGYTWNGSVCTVIDVCVNNPCGPNASCTQQDGSFRCSCVTGYTWNGSVCTVIDVCVNNPCGPNASCTQQDGSFRCSCVTGYTWNGSVCTDVNECQSGSHDCHSSASCFNNPGSFQCVCKAGHTGDGSTCTDVNECQSGSHDCHSSASCFNSPGSFQCVCKAGHTGDGRNCSGSTFPVISTLKLFNGPVSIAF
ncbi:fibrillin-2-like [Scyliorhinus canicula]|uniref:fibrillin-2-like n=1 Tax=Scyliorhinus canicula TaxID=7830 RepID=UPI0018F7A549|nr:fibrillin-2-like [Scyliorhinus canicula]